MVRFTYDSNLNSKQKACIKAALLDLQSKTNVRFYNSTGQSQHDNVYNIDYPYVNFIYKKGDTSESKIGRVGGRQDIELADFAFDYALYLGDYGIIEHEICHALGMMHEQQRPDRDDYVTINWNNLTSKGLQTSCPCMAAHPDRQRDQVSSPSFLWCCSTEPFQMYPPTARRRSPG